MLKSKNDHDWLGHGFYFWEGNKDRALAWAEARAKYPRPGGQKIQHPFVIGAILDLGHCLNLLDHDALGLVQKSYQALQAYHDKAGIPLPKNRGSKDLLLRHLDCAVIEALHQNNQESEITQYDSVRAVFVEGDELYPNAGFREKNHMQICVRNEECIKGFFHPRRSDGEWRQLGL